MLGGKDNTAFNLDTSGSIAFERERLIPSAQGNVTKEKTKDTTEQLREENYYVSLIVNIDIPTEVENVFGVTFLNALSSTTNPDKCTSCLLTAKT